MTTSDDYWRREYALKRGIDPALLRAPPTPDTGPPPATTPATTLVEFDPSTLQDLASDAPLTAVQAITAIHRHADGYVAFAVSDPKFHHTFSLRPQDIRQLLPVIRDFMLEDAYFSINAFFAAKTHQRHGPTGLPGVLRRTNALRRLNAAYVDLDIGRTPEDAKTDLQLTPTAAGVGRFIDAQDRGRIPTASIIARSGRGLYGFWFLVEDYDSLQSPRSFHRHCATLQAINVELAARLKCLAPDISAGKDLARMFRIPGSVHSRAQKVCTYWLQADPDGKPYYYTIHDLAAAVGVRAIEPFELPPASDAAELPTPTSKPKPGSAKGPRKTAEQRLQDLAALEQFRGGFQKGTRRWAILFRCMTLHHLGYSPAAIAAAAEQTQARCTPPDHDEHYTPTQLAQQVVSGKTGFLRRISGAFMAMNLRVTEDDAMRLDLQQIVPRSIRQKRKMDRPPSRKAIRQAVEMEYIRTYQQRHPGHRPTMVRVHDHLQNSGILCSQRTVGHDMVALEKTGRIPELQRHRPGRPRKRQ